MDEIDIYLNEDLGEEGDITSQSLFTDEKGKGQIIAKDNCVVAGLKETEIIFKKVGANTKSLVKDGGQAKKGTVVAEINGPIQSILKGERLSLNMMGKMSGIATETKKLVDMCKKINPDIKIAATRKTTPGFRKYEKKAVVLGGGEAHRYGLFDAVMIKDNHIKAVGSVKKAINVINQKITNKTIEVEVENEHDALSAANMKVDVILLDNFDFETAKNLTKKIRSINPDILIEISGGITPENIIEYVSFAGRISLGYLTHSVKNIDFSLEIM